MKVIRFIMTSKLWVAAGLCLLVVPASHILDIPFDWRISLLGFFTAFLVYSLDGRFDIWKGDWQPPGATMNYFQSSLFLAVITLSVFGILSILIISPPLISLGTLICIATVFVYNFRIIPSSGQWRSIKDFPGAKAWFTSFLIASAAVLSPLLFTMQKINGDNLGTTLITLLFFFAVICCNAHMYDIRDMKTDKKNQVYTLPNLIGLTKTKRLLHGINCTAAIIIILGWVFNAYSFHPELILWNISTALYLFFIGNNNSHLTFDLFIDGTLFIPALYLLFFNC